MNGLRILGSEKKLKTFSVDLWWKLSKTLNKILNVGMNGQESRIIKNYRE